MFIDICQGEDVKATGIGIQDGNVVCSAMFEFVDVERYFRSDNEAIETCVFNPVVNIDRN